LVGKKKARKKWRCQRQPPHHYAKEEKVAWGDKNTVFFCATFFVANEQDFQDELEAKFGTFTHLRGDLPAPSRISTDSTDPNH
jgi:hypothetical protein